MMATKSSKVSSSQASLAKASVTRVSVSKQLPVLDMAGKSTGTVELPGQLFDVETNIPLIHQVVVAQQAAARSGTHSTKTRGNVSGGGAKPYRQKGTGRARQGSIRSPQFAGGGVVHGPLPRSYSQRTPKKMKAAALRCALSDRARHDLLFVLDRLVTSDTPSTKAARGAIAAVTAASHVLVVLTRDDDVAVLSSRNLPSSHVLYVDQLNTYDVMVNDALVFTKAALDQFITMSNKDAASTRNAAAAGSGKSSDELIGVGAGSSKQEEAA